MEARVPKLGLIVPSLNAIMEFEMQRMAAGAMSIHTMRVSAHTTPCYSPPSLLPAKRGR